ncbi:MAG TPA: hypothetical protein VII47_05860 [Actinomycetota bacterium]|jgi:hypothetical protein
MILIVVIVLAAAGVLGGVLLDLSGPMILVLALVGAALGVALYGLSQNLRKRGA